MKKIISVALASLVVCSAVSAQSFKLVNTFGGDSDSTGGSDLFAFENQKEKDDEGKEKDSYSNDFANKTRVSDRLQLDVSAKNFDSRLRVEFGTTQLNGKKSDIRFRGYGRFKPIEQLQFIAGNDLFTKVAVDAGYLAASDDYPKHARILQNGFGAISSWKFGEEKNIYVNFAGGVKGTDDSFLDIDKLGLDFGFNFGVKKLFSAGATFQNVTNSGFTTGIFAGLNSVENLTLNAGYIYNATDTDFIAAKAKHTASVTVGYNLKNIGLYLGADVVTSLGNKYLSGSDTKGYSDKYDENGDEDGKDLIPFFTKVRAEFKVTETISICAKAKVYAMLGDNDAVKTELYPYVSYTMPNKMGTLSGGVRFNIEDSDLTKFAIPLTWKCTLVDVKR